MEGSQINSVKVDAVAGTATVSATFREAVVAHRGASEPVQAFRWGAVWASGRSWCGRHLMQPLHWPADSCTFALPWNVPPLLQERSTASTTSWHARAAPG